MTRKHDDPLAPKVGSCASHAPCVACVGRPPDPYEGLLSDRKLRGFEHHPITCAVHRGYPTPWGHACDCGLLRAIRNGAEVGQ